MPRGKSKNDSRKQDVNETRKYYATPDAPWGGYVDLALDEDQRATFNDWFLSPNNNQVQLLVDALGEGLAYTLKWDAENQCFISSFTGAGVDKSNERYCLTSRSDNINEALGLLIYKHVELLRGDWGAYTPKTRNVRKWG